MDSIDEVDIPSMSDVKKCLKEAGSYDATMSEREMLEIYQVLRHSRNTACEEDEQRRILQQAEVNYKELEELRKNSVPVENDGKDDDTYILGGFEDIAACSSSEDRSEVKEKSFSSETFDFEEELPSTTIATKYSQHNRNAKSKPEEVDFIDVFDCAPTKHRPLKHIPMNPQYDSPFYCSRQVADKEIKERARMIYSYHLALHRIYDNYQKQSIYPAPWGKAIQPATLRFNGSLLKKIEKLKETTATTQDDSNVINEYSQESKNDKNSDDDFETYVSKSGRQTKRKLYTEDVEDDNELHKKSKSTADAMDTDTEWYVKRKPMTSTVNSDKKTTSIKKRRSIGTLSNEEIMKRSKLFTPTNTNSGRSEKMFEILVEEDHKKKEAQKELEKFHESLTLLSDEENEENVEQSQELDIADIVHQEEPFSRRRIAPPSYAKKPGRGRSGGRGRGRKTNKSTQEGSSQEVTSSKYQPLESSLVKKSSSKKKDRCPICSEEFLQSELVEHASSCIESYSEKNDKKKSSEIQYGKITCETCDKVFTLDTTYEEHVHECIVRQLNKNNISS